MDGSSLIDHLDAMTTFNITIKKYIVIVHVWVFDLNNLQNCSELN